MQRKQLGYHVDKHSSTNILQLILAFDNAQKLAYVKVSITQHKQIVFNLITMRNKSLGMALATVPHTTWYLSIINRL